MPQIIDLPSTEATHLLDMLGLAGTLSGLALSQSAVTHYRLQPLKGRALFLKIVEPARRPPAERAEAIGSWLANQGLPIAAPIDGYPRVLADGQLAVLSPMIDGRRAEATAADLAALGASVAHLHRVLAKHPDRHSWEAATTERIHELDEIRRALADGTLRAGPLPGDLQLLAADSELAFNLTDTPAAPLHGDLNAGNVLMDLHSQQPVLLDFEDVFHSVLPTIFELIFMVERFVLVPTSDDAAALRLGHTLLDAYFVESRGQPAKSSRAPSDLLRSLSLRSLCILAIGETRGIAISHDEWAKFFELERHARARAPLINRIMRGVFP